MNGIALAELWNDIREDYLLDAIPPSYAAGTILPPRRKGSLGRFLSSPVAAVILSVVVSGAVLTGIILAGQSGPNSPPAGAVSGDSTETDDTILPPDTSTSETSHDGRQPSEPDPDNETRPNQNDPGQLDTEESEPEPGTEIETRPPGYEETEPPTTLETFPADVSVAVPGLMHPVSVPQGSTVRSAQQSNLTVTNTGGIPLDLHVRICEVTVPEINRYATTDAVYMDICDPDTGEILQKLSFFGFTTVVSDKNSVGDSWAILNICPIRNEDGSISLEFLAFSYTLLVQDDSGEIAVKWSLNYEKSMDTTCAKESYFSTKFPNLCRYLQVNLADFREPSVVICTDRVLRVSDSAPLPTCEQILIIWDRRNYRDAWNAYRGKFPA